VEGRGLLELGDGLAQGGVSGLRVVEAALAEDLEEERRVERGVTLATTAAPSGLFISRGLTKGPSACALRSAARPSQNWPPSGVGCGTPSASGIITKPKRGLNEA
jgi:hypothetical protein